MVLCILMSLRKYCTVGAIINFVFFHDINSTAEFVSLLLKQMLWESSSHSTILLFIVIRSNSTPLNIFCHNSDS